MTQRVFITGASGCVGRYVLEALAARTDCDVHVLVRRPGSAGSAGARPGFVEHIGCLEDLPRHAQDAVIASDVILHLATDWTESPRAHAINVDATLALAQVASGGSVRRFVYCSTASVFDAQLKVSPVAAASGTAYVRSKVRAFIALTESPIAPRLVTLAPTLVFGGGGDRPASQITRELRASRRWAALARFVRPEGSFHFVHAADLAALAVRLVDHDPPASLLVVGQPPVTFADALAALCRVTDRRYRGWIPLAPARLLAIARLVRPSLTAWDAHCLANPHFRYPATAPDDCGVPSTFPTIDDVLRDALAAPAA